MTPLEYLISWEGLSDIRVIPVIYKDCETGIITIYFDGEHFLLDKEFEYAVEAISKCNGGGIPRIPKPLTESGKFGENYLTLEIFSNRVSGVILWVFFSCPVILIRGILFFSQSDRNYLLVKISRFSGRSDNLNY